MDYSLPKIKKFSDYTNTHIFMKKCLLQSLLFIVILLILYMIYYVIHNKLWYKYKILNEEFGNRGKCKKLYKSELDGSNPPDDCIEEDFTNIPKSIKSSQNDELSYDELSYDELSIIVKYLPSVINSQIIEEYFNSIKIYSDNFNHNTSISKIKFDPQIDIQYILITILSSLSSNVNIDISSIASYCYVYFIINDKKPLNINNNYNSIDGMLIHSLEYVNIPGDNIVKVMMNFANKIDIELFHWVFYK